MSQFESAYRDVQAVAKHAFPNVGTGVLRYTQDELDGVVTARVDEPVCDMVWVIVWSELRP